MELGDSFYPFPAYLNGWVGYRWREPKEEAQRDFADEGFVLAQAGGNYGALGLQLVVDGMTSVTTPMIEGILLPNAERSMLQVTPKISCGVGPGVMSLGARLPLGGKNLSAGTSVVVGYFTNWSL